MEVVNPIVSRWQREARDDLEGFWGRAAEQLPWFRAWDRVFEWTFPTFRWYRGGLTNLSFNCLDHHVAHGRAGHAALVYANERGERQVYTYAQLRREVMRAAAALQGMGIGKGDRVTIYMPTCPEAIVLMLAAVRIGAIHSVVYAGFGAGALADRIHASGSRLVFTPTPPSARAATCRCGGSWMPRSRPREGPSSTSWSSPGAGRARRCVPAGTR